MSTDFEGVDVDVVDCSGGERWLKFKDGYGCQIGAGGDNPEWRTTIQLEEKEAVEIAIAILDRYRPNYHTIKVIEDAGLLEEFTQFMMARDLLKAAEEGTGKRKKSRSKGGAS